MSKNYKCLKSSESLNSVFFRTDLKMNRVALIVQFLKNLKGM
jgi:hypothetical protein